MEKSLDESELLLRIIRLEISVSRLEEFAKKTNNRLRFIESDISKLMLSKTPGDE